MIRINDQGKIELLVDPRPPKRFQLRMDAEFYGIWKMFKELGPARSMRNEQIFQGMIATLISKHPWLETLAEKHQKEIRDRADMFEAWWEMSGGLPSEIPTAFGSSNQVGAPVRPGRGVPGAGGKRFDPNAYDWSEMERDMVEQNRKLGLPENPYLKTKEGEGSVDRTADRDGQ